jgi:hypothetical protein
MLLQLNPLTTGAQIFRRHRNGAKASLSLVQTTSGCEMNILTIRNLASVST